MTSDPLVSIILPTFNRERWIEASVSSALSQTYKNIEIILIDDGSVDNTREILSKIDDPRLRYHYQPNRGRSNARNHALLLAEGHYIAFLDSDDLFLPDKTRLQVEYLQSNPGTGMVYTSAQCIGENGEPIDYEYIANRSGMIYKDVAFFKPVTITLPTVMTYRHVIDAVGGFDEEMYRFEDTDMWRRISKEYRVDAMPAYTCLLRTHDNNDITSQNPDGIVKALDYYAAKLLKEDSDIGEIILRDGLRALFEYYAKSFEVYPQFSKHSSHLMERARAF
ncbi:MULTISPECIES: glycosyltransferase family A protein [unclassified Ensifer]|uniref:glycosyltransferase family 2 protein n=1 Tax=unclassified Ensifer TaxID=2633371 RepID=UPI0009F23B88|nr:MULTISPECIES: glycosyltransferase family A protein [unclassified Ensifer]